MSESKKEEKEKCFVIMPISDQGDYPMGHFTKVYEQIIKPSVEAAGYEAYRVDENNICDTIISKIFSAIQECPMAICDLSNRNPNVLYELGLRQAYDKPVVLIQDEKTDEIFDVSGISTVFYKSTRLYEDVIEARENIKKAILATKEGKVNTLAKIMKVSAADFSQVEVSQDVKINVMLEGIYNEIRGLKNKKETEHVPLSKSNTIMKTVAMFECIDYKTIVQFRGELFCNVVGLMEVDPIELARTTWKIYFGFKPETHIDREMKKIFEIAAGFNIESNERYTVLDY